MRRHGCVCEEKDYCAEDDSRVDESDGLQLPLSLRLAVLGILIIVVFVYITVEKKPLLG
jgi:hypothetical protein